MKRTILILLTVLTIVTLSASLGLISSGSTKGTGDIGARLPTEDIGARLPVDVKITPTSFTPNLTATQAISIAREFAEKGFNIPKPEVDALAARTTVALFTGKPDVPGPKLADRRVGVVVFDNFDYVSAYVPYGSKATYGDYRYTLILDDQSGEVVYSVVIGKRLDSLTHSP